MQNAPFLSYCFVCVRVLSFRMKLSPSWYAEKEFVQGILQITDVP